jgi:hypothetical protein
MSAASTMNRDSRCEDSECFKASVISELRAARYGVCSCCVPGIFSKDDAAICFAVVLLDAMEGDREAGAGGSTHLRPLAPALFGRRCTPDATRSDPDSGFHVRS